MRTILILAAAGALFMIAAAPGQEAVTVAPTMAMAEQTATQALGTFARLVDRNNFRVLGFESPEQVRQARLGDPIETFMIRLDSLQAAGPSTVPDQLLQRIGSVTYPVLVGDRVLSGLTVKARGDSWQPSSFGAASQVRELAALRDRLAADKGVGRLDFFEVKVPALQLAFLGYREGGGLFLTPLRDDPRFGFKSGVTLRAEQVVEAVVPTAREQKDLPG